MTRALLTASIGLGLLVASAGDRQDASDGPTLRFARNRSPATSASATHGSEELAVGWRDAKPGVAIYVVDREGALRSKLIVDDGGMAAEDLAIADLDGDKQPDIVVSGRATRKIKIYWNETRAPAARQR